MVAHMIQVQTFDLRHRLSPGKYTGKVLKPKNEGVGTLWLNKYLCHLVTGIYIFRWPNNAIIGKSKIFLDLNA